MAMTLREIRDKYPQYDSKSDKELADAIHAKYYSSLPKEKVYSKLGLIEDADIPAEEEETTGLLGVGADLAEGLGNAFSKSKKFVGDLPENLEKMGGDILEHPVSGRLHPLGQLAAETTDVGKSIINAPYNLNQYLARKHLLPQVLGKLGKIIPHIPEDTGIEKALGLEADPEKGDAIMRAVPNIAALGSGASSIGKAVSKVIKAPSKEALFQRALRDNIGKAEAEHALSTEELSKLKDALVEEYSSKYGEKIGTLTPVKQQESINVKQHKLEKNRPLTEIPEEHVGEIPPEPDTKAIINEKKTAVEEARKHAEETLGVLDNPKLKGGAIVQKSIKDLKKSSSELYDAARNHYLDKQILADNSVEIKAATKELEALKDADELVPGYGSGTAEQKALEANINALKKEKVNASDVFDLQRTMEKIAQDTRKKQFSGVNELEFKRIGSIADRLESHADKLATRLEAVGGKDVQSMIKKANKGWRTLKELEKNSVGKAALSKGELPNRAMIDIANTQPGNEFLRALVDSDADLKKHMLAAYTGESNVNKLTKPNTLTKKYLQDLPEVEDKVMALKEAIAGVKEGEVKAAAVKKDYDELVSSMKKAAEQQKIRQDAITESEKLRGQIEFHEKAIPKLKEKIKVEQEKGHGVQKLKDELEEHNRNLKEKGGRLKALGSTVLKIKGLQGMANKIGL